MAMIARGAPTAAGVLGLKAGTSRELIAEIRKGLPQRALKRLQKALHLTQQDMARLLQTSARTLQRRGVGARLSQDESDRLYRLGRVFSWAAQALGDEEKAARWMQKRNLALGGVTPLHLLDTEAGAEEVHNVLGAIMYGGVT